MNSTTLQDWANIATIAMAMFTAVALVAVGVQIRATRKMQEQAAARQLYAEFLKFVAETPTAVSEEIIAPGSKYDWSMYLWITALESGWLAFDGNPEWQQRIVSCVKQNRAYFKSDYWLGRGKYEGRDASQDFNATFLKAFKAVIADEELHSPTPAAINQIAAE